MGWPVRIAVVGAGARGRIFAAYADQFPDEVRVVAVVDPVPHRCDVIGERHRVPRALRMADWRELTTLPRVADAVVVATPDREHAEAGRAFAELGYAVLLEKPIAPTEAECLALIDAVERADVPFAVCHMLRYTGYTALVKQAVEDGRVGEVIGVQHFEPVGWWHFAHSYVRGNWRRADESAPSLLAKCCHDLDWLRYLVGRPAVRVSSVGALHHFHAGNRPAGATDRCVDCPVEADCAYSALRTYLPCLGDPARERWPLSVVTPDLTEHGVRAALADGPYGRCVYACDNDVVDHQTVTVEFDGGATAAMVMSAFTPMTHRRTRVMGSRGFLDGDSEQIVITDFVTGRTQVIRARTELTASVQPEGSPVGGHNDGDFEMIEAFVRAVATGDRRLIRSGPWESLDSHLIAFAAERSRRDGGMPVPVGDGRH